jgi:hypothetical protein
MEKKYNVIDSFWFGTIGIVKIDNGFEEKWYIGEASGLNKEDDEQYIATFGKPFYPKTMEQFFNLDKK